MTRPGYRRLLWTLLALTLVTGAAVALWARSTSRTRADRALVYSWIETTERRDPLRTEMENERMKFDALRAMGGMPIDVLRQDLRNTAWWVRMLQKFPAGQRFLTTSSIATDAKEARHRAVYHLGRLGEPARVAVPELIPLASDPDPWIRGEVAFTLGLLRVNSPATTQVLETLRMDSDRATRFAADIALWNLDRTDAVRRDRVLEQIQPSYISWPSLCLRSLGPDAAPFAPALRRSMLEMEWSMARAQAVGALWAMERDRDFVLQQIASVEADVIQTKGQSVRGSDWTRGERAAAFLVQYLDEERAFRDRLRPVLRRILEEPNSGARRFATNCLQKFDNLDHRGETPVDSTRAAVP